MNRSHILQITLLIVMMSGLVFSNALAAPASKDRTPTVQAPQATPATLPPTEPSGPAETLIPTETPIPTEAPTEVPTEPPTATPSATLPPTEATTPTTTATPTETPVPTQGSLRPVVVIESYSANPNQIPSGGSFVLEIHLANHGQTRAHNLVVTFSSADFLPQKTGGVLAVSELEPGESKKVKQSFIANSTLAGLSYATLQATVNYVDESGLAFTEAFTMTLNLKQPTYSGVGATATPTPTGTPIARAQLVISGYKTDVEVLKPGTQFTLALQVYNSGTELARRVVMVAGGADVSPGQPGGEGTPGAPGVTASGGDFTNFSPLGVSNVQSLGDLAPGDSLTAQQPLIVNVSANPGAYSFKISFAYYDPQGNLQIDDQVITLLVHQPPIVDINFYRDPGPIFAGQPNVLPLQIVNLGRKSAVLGAFRVTAENAFVENGSVQVGALETGGYYPLDAMLTPNQPGPLELQVTVDYTDDFNQSQTITMTIPLEVLEAQVIDPGMEPGGEPGMGPGGEPGTGGPLPGEPETFWQAAMRFLRGLIGLDSGRPAMVDAAPPGVDPLGPSPEQPLQ